jgi:hypothetical protein
MSESLSLESRRSFTGSAPRGVEDQLRFVVGAAENEVLFVGRTASTLELSPKQTLTWCKEHFDLEAR